jgi:uncharacterized RDD family membrane protein YckC
MNAPGLVRRLAAMVYDALLVAAVAMIAVALTLPLSGGEAVAVHAGMQRTLMQAWIVLVTGGFFTWFWVHGGQTLGMKAWRMRVVRADGTALRWRDAVVRFAWAVPSLAAAGLGLLWMVFDRDRMALHDRLSRTRVVIL